MRVVLRVVAVGAVLTALAMLPIAAGRSAPQRAVPEARTSTATIDVACTGRPALLVGYRPPVPGRVTRLFDPPAMAWGSGHRGVDLAAEPGATVTSPGAGVITFAGTVAGRGVVTVRHPDGLRSSLEPVDPDVAKDDPVVAGTTLGTVQDRPGHDGVHWGVRDGTAYLDPLGLLGCREPVVLLP